MSNDNEKEKIFIFGIDGATFSLMNEWIEKGDLPTLESLTKNGTSSVCYSSIPPVSCPAWKCFAAGMNPAKLGIFDLLCRERDTYNIRPARADMVDVPDVWDILGAHKYKVGVFNVPVTYPPHQVNGFVVSGMLGSYDAPDFTYPPELKREIEKIIDTPYEIEVELKDYPSPDAWLEKQHAITEMKADIAKYLLENKEWDFFITVFYEVDRVQHAFWHFMDKDHPRHAPSHFENTIRNSYRRMDKILGDILDILGDSATVIVMSDHGFGPLKGYFRLNQWLLSQKYLNLNQESMKAFFEDVAERFLKKESSREPPPLNTIGGLYKIEWSSTKAFAVRMGNLYLNVRGREPEGIVEMGKEYEEVRNQLIKDLSKVVHPKTKKPLKVTIRKKEDVYSGKHFHDAPDLIVSIEEYTYLIEQGFGPMWGGMEGGGYATGGHQMDGIFIASGQDIRKDQWIDPISLVDIAPTILHIMKVKIPHDMDGKVLLPLFKEGSDPASREIDISPIQVHSQLKEYSQPKKSSEDDEKVLRRLRDLGYIE